MILAFLIIIIFIIIYFNKKNYFTNCKNREILWPENIFPYPAIPMKPKWFFRPLWNPHFYYYPDQKEHFFI